MSNANGKIPLEEWEPLKNLTRQSNVSELLILWYNERVRPVMNAYEQQLLRVLEKWSLTYNNIMLQNIINFFVQQINTDIHHAYFHQSPGLHLLTGPARPANLQMLDSDIRLMKMSFVSRNEEDSFWFDLDINSWWFSYRQRLEVLNAELNALESPQWREQHHNCNKDPK